MKTIEFVIQSAVGMHARPAGMLVNTVNGFQSVVQVEFKDKKADARKLFALMKLGAKQNDKICITIDGADEEKSAAAIQEVLQKYF